MAEGAELSPDLLLCESGWLERFTRALAQDANVAEDLTQDVLVRGLSRPREKVPTRAWLARVARNLAVDRARREARRQQAERVAVQDGVAPDTAEVVAQAELQSAAVRALLELHEPYRSTLLWRFMKGLSTREVALHLSVPVETVRTRIKRGLALLRSRLDHEYGSRRAWLPPFAMPWRLITPALWGIVLMKAKAKVVLAAGLLLAGVLGLWYTATPPTSSPTVTEGSRGGILTADLTEPDAAPGERIALQPESPPPAEVETASLLVRVTWKDNGEPAEHVGLHVAEERWASLGHLSSTGEDGTARFGGLEPGSFKVNMDRLNDHREQAVDLAAGEEAVLDLEVNRGVDVRGVVVDPQGIPVPDAEVLVLWAYTAPQWWFPTTRSDGQGTFFLRSLGSLNMIGARAPGRAHSDFQTVDAAERVGPGEVFVRLILPGPAVGLAGTVYDPEGKELPGALVVVETKPQLILRTDARGEFDAGSLQPGVKPVRVYAEGFAAWEGEVECLPSGTASMGIQLQRGATLSGRVTDGEGRPLGGVRIQVSGLHYPQLSSVRSDREGRYRMEDLPGGERSVAAYGELGSRQETLYLTAGQETHWDVALDPGLVIRGILVDSSGEPLEGWWVREGGVGPSSVTDREGRFLLAQLEDRPHDLTLYESRMLFLPRVLTLEDVYPGGPEQTWVVPGQAMPSSWIHGRVLDPAGSPVTDVDLYLSLYQGDSYVDHDAEPDGEGRFEIGPLPPDTYTLRAGYPDRLPADFGEIVLVPDEVRHLADGRLSYGAHLEVTIRSASPEQLEGIEAEVLDAEGKRVRDTVQYGPPFRFPVLPPGPHTLSITGPNIENRVLPIELVARKTLTLEVDLR